jgi:hypothetical protein
MISSWAPLWYFLGAAIRCTNRRRSPVQPLSGPVNGISVDCRKVPARFSSLETARRSPYYGTPSLQTKRTGERGTAQMKAEKAAVPVAAGGGDEWQCRKHRTPRSGGGACPYCLRDRLLRLCPNCAHVRPCACASACASPPSSSSASGEAGGRIRSLIEREPRVARSRSVAAGSSAAAVPDAAAARGGGRQKARVWGWPPFWKATANAEEEGPVLPRSSSVSATAVESKTAAAPRWRWHFPSPLKAFRHRRSSASVVGRA